MSDVSFGEKTTWIYAVVTVGVAVAYFATIFGQDPGVDVTEIAYFQPMLMAVSAAVLLTVIAQILIAIASPKEGDKKDERDTHINRFGENVGYYVLSLGILLVLGLVVAEVEHFWIANAIYLAYVVAALISSIAKIVVYRKGFWPW